MGDTIEKDLVEIFDGRRVYYADSKCKYSPGNNKLGIEPNSGRKAGRKVNE